MRAVEELTGLVIREDAAHTQRPVAKASTFIDSSTDFRHCKYFYGLFLNTYAFV
jgi:hypothetical protein